MSRVALRVITIVYTITLGFTYFVTHPPEWVRRVAVSAERSGTIRVFGHRVHLAAAIHPRGPDWREIDAALIVPWDNRGRPFPGCTPWEQGPPDVLSDPSDDSPAATPEGSGR